jgi:hypothetical protein
LRRATVRASARTSPMQWDGWAVVVGGGSERGRGRETQARWRGWRRATVQARAMMARWHAAGDLASAATVCMHRHGMARLRGDPHLAVSDSVVFWVVVGRCW